MPDRFGPGDDLFEVAPEISNRLIGIFLRNRNGCRPVFGEGQRFQTDPHCRVHILFYEYYHGDNWAGIGASHQTGWSGLVATLIDIFRNFDAAQLLDAGKKGFFAREQPEPKPSRPDNSK